METNNRYTWKQRAAQYSSILLISTAFLISCQKKNDSGTAYVAPAPITQPGVVGNCVGCNFQQAQLGMPTSRYSNYLTVQWELIGDNVAVQQLLAYGQSATMYTGQAALRGTMTVTTPITFGGGYGGAYVGGVQYGCQLAAGQYQVNTLQVGQMSTGQFQFPQVEFVSTAGTGVRAVFSFSGVVSSMQGGGTISNLFGQLIPVAFIVNGAQVSCSDAGIYLSY